MEIKKSEEYGQIEINGERVFAYHALSAIAAALGYQEYLDQLLLSHEELADDFVKGGFVDSRAYSEKELEEMKIFAYLLGEINKHLIVNIRDNLESLKKDAEWQKF